MKKWLTLTAVFSLCACSIDDAREVMMGGDVNRPHFEDTEYKQDSSTGLCFLVYRQTTGIGLTNVPCSAEVLAEIRRSHKSN